jgi:hypothetical protein
MPRSCSISTMSSSCSGIASGCSSRVDRLGNAVTS